jgi:hypothetical protein
MHNSLRSQTQIRVNEGVLGFDTPPDKSLIEGRFAHKTGVGKLDGFREHKAATLTSSVENGDFSLKVAGQAGIYPGQIPLVLVVKKNYSVLRNVLRWTESTVWAKDTVQGKYIENVPFLMIDDEADNASVNTNSIYDGTGNIDIDSDITRINGLIREILTKYEKSAYIGYTATPFANIFIDPESESGICGQDLFPRSFIVSLPSSSGYIGPDKIFGLNAAPELNIGKTDGLPLVINISDYGDYIPDRHNKYLKIDELPPSLKESVRYFILASAAREVRGQKNTHNSMLVHVTRFVDVQNQVAELLLKELEIIRHRLKYGEGKSTLDIRDEFRKLWEDNFVPVSAFIAESDEIEDSAVGVSRWDDVEKHLLKYAFKTQVITANGSSKEALEYRSHRENGLSAVVVGGDKLSRGLTLEGLTVSYFLRASRMYDTLMQMGRWFGFHPGYPDLCRIFTTPELSDWYSHISLANMELREELRHMADRGMTPQEYGLRVRNHPDTLIITSLNKMRAGETVRVSYSGTISESVVYHNDRGIIQKNNAIYSEFLRKLETPSKYEGKKEYYKWTAVPGESVAGLFSDIETHEDSFKADSHLLENYIRNALRRDELREWTVILLSGGSSGKRERLNAGGYDVSCIIRSLSGSIEGEGGKFSIKRLVSPRDEWLDFDREMQDRIMKETLNEYEISKEKSRRKKPPSNPSGIIIREKRSEKNGLLLLYPLVLREKSSDGSNISGRGETVIKTIGFAVSFPKSRYCDVVEYRVNRIFSNNEAV